MVKRNGVNGPNGAQGASEVGNGGARRGQGLSTERQGRFSVISYVRMR